MIFLETGFRSVYGPNHPRVAFNSATRRGTTTASSEATGFEAVNAASPFEYNYWKPTSTGTEWLKTSLSTAETINAVCIAAHNLGTVGATVQVQITDGVWDDVGPAVSPEDDEPIAILLNDRDLTDIRIEVTGASDIPRIGVVYFCETLEFPQRAYVSQETPYNLAQNTEFKNNRTIAGKWAGRSIKRQRRMSDLPIRHLREPWVESNMTGFIEDAVSYPYFLMPRPYDYPKNVGYKWAKGDIRPVRMGVSGDMMEVTV